MEHIESTTIKVFLDRYPAAVGVFMDYRLRCVGCPAEKFHTVRDTAKNHELDLDHFTRALQGAISGCNDDYSDPGGQAISNFMR